MKKTITIIGFLLLICSGAALADEPPKIDWSKMKTDGGKSAFAESWEKATGKDGPFEKQRAELKPEQIRDLAAKSTATLNMGKTLGTGFFVGKGTLVTNHHVLGGGISEAEVTVPDANGIEKLFWISRILADDPEHDLALVEVCNMGLGVRLKSLADLPGLPLANPYDRPKEGQDVHVLGNPKGYKGTFSSGRISAYREGKELYGKWIAEKDAGGGVPINARNGDIIQFTAPISHGSSGSALLNNRGEVVGVCFATEGSETGAQNINFATTVKYVRELLKKAGK